MTAKETPDLPSPLIDLEAICIRNIDNEEEFHRIGKEIIKGFEEKGYVYLTNHGVPKEKIELYIKGFDKFFDLDKNIKEKYPRDRETLHGYTTSEKEGFEHTHELISDRESFDFQDFEQGLPSEAPWLEEVISGVLEKSVPMIEKVMRAIGSGLGVPYDLFGAYHTDLMKPQNFCNLRIARYCPITQDVADQLRFEEHVDLGTTVTFQLCDDVGGLQLQNREGKWVDAQISSDAFLIFPSKVLQKWTADRILGTLHRVCLPRKEEDLKQFRRAIIFFCTPIKDAIIKCFDGSDKYPPITGREEMAKAVLQFYDKTQK